MDVYRRALTILPNDRDITLALLSLFGPDDDGRERLEVMERLLATEEGDSAVQRALELAGEWEALDDEEGVRRCLERGHAIVPGSVELRERLETWYRENGEWRPLAELLVREAERAKAKGATVSLLRNAAGIYRDTLRDLDGAAAALAAARTHVPEDIDLLVELAHVRAEAGDHETAIAEVGRELDAFSGTVDDRARLLKLRAELCIGSGDGRAAVMDLEAAYSQVGAAVAPELLGALEQQRAQCTDRGDNEGERASTLRLVQVMSESGDAAQARFMLTEWTDRHPRDRQALTLLRGVQEVAGEWEQLAQTCARLIDIEDGEAQIESVLRYADAYERAGRPAASRLGLERVYQQQPDDRRLRDKLRRLYEQVGATEELAALLLADAESTTDEEGRFALLRRAGDLYLKSEGGVHAAIGPLESAAALRPADHETLILLVDAYLACERFAEAGQLLEQAISAHTRRRSPQLAELQQRMARLAQAAGDANLQLQWLQAALESDKNNPLIAGELASLAMEIGEQETALAALRAITLMKTEGPMTRAMAFLWQARIAHQRGEARRAILWGRKARSEDPALEEAAEFLRQLGES